MERNGTIKQLSEKKHQVYHQKWFIKSDHKNWRSNQKKPPVQARAYPPDRTSSPSFRPRPWTLRWKSQGEWRKRPQCPSIRRKCHDLQLVSNIIHSGFGYLLTSCSAVIFILLRPILIIIPRDSLKMSWKKDGIQDSQKYLALRDVGWLWTHEIFVAPRGHRKL